MVEIADNNNPLLNAMEELNKGIQSLGNTQQTMLQYTVSKDISNKQEKSKEDVMAAAARDVDLVQQGQEVQLTRDAQLINDRNNKQLQNLSPGGQALATNEEASQTRTLLTVLTERVNALKEFIPVGFNETKAVLGKRFELAKEQFNAASSLENLFGAVKGDTSLLLGGLGALQQLPFFNVIKVAVFFLIKMITKSLGFIGGLLGKGLGMLGGKLFPEFAERQKQSAQAQKDRDEEALRLQKEIVELEEKIASGDLNPNAPQAEESIITGPSGTKIQKPPVETKSELDITKDQLDIAKRNLTENQQQTFQAKLGNKILGVATATFGRFYKFITPILKIFRLKFVLIGALLISVAAAIYFMRDYIKDKFNKLLEFFGFKPKNEEDAAAVEKFTTQEDRFGRNTGEEGFFNKNALGASDINMDKIGDVSSKDLLALLREEGDDLKKADRIAIDKEIADRIDKNKGIKGTYSAAEIEALQEQRMKLAETEKELEVAKSELSRGRNRGGASQDAGYYTNVVNNMTSQQITAGTGQQKTDANVSGSVN